MAIRTVGIVGAGTMGAGIAQVALEAGHQVVLFDADARVVARARERISDGLTRRARKQGQDTGALDAQVEARLRSLSDAFTLEDLASRSNLVIEAALEDLAVKRALFRTLDDAAPPGAILATNTSALSVAAVASATRHAERVLGLHFFNPAPVMALVEVVATPKTDPALAETATNLMHEWGKTPVRCTDSPGFIVNRVNRPFTLEPLAMLSARFATVARIDRAVRAAGFPMGPFELMDLVGLDVNLAAARGIFEAVRARDEGPNGAERFRPSPIQERLVAEHHLGRKTNAGFYLYDADGRSTGPAPGFDIREVEHGAIDDSEIVERVVLAIVNEAYRALGDDVATRDDIDLAMRLGAGHAVGPFEGVTRLGGPAAVLAALRRHEREGPRFEPAPALVDEATR